MCTPYAPGATPEWFGLGLRHAILGACPEQYDPLNRPCYGLDTHSFASSDDDDCLVPPHSRSRAITCRRETLRLFQDAVRRPSLRSHQSTEIVSPTAAASSACPARSVSGSVGQTTRRYGP